MLRRRITALVPPASAASEVLVSSAWVCGRIGVTVARCYGSTQRHGGSTTRGHGRQANIPTAAATATAAAAVVQGAGGNGSSILCDGQPLPEWPHQCGIERVLLPSVSLPGVRADTLRGMVQLLLDPDADSVEEVAMVDFVAMVPRRQLAALRGNKEWMEVITESERYQSYRDVRALRLAGVNTVGKWDENRDRVAISAFSRGLLEDAYTLIMQQPSRGQQTQLKHWIEKSITMAIIGDVVASLGKSDKSNLLPLLMSSAQAPSETAPPLIASVAPEAAASVGWTGHDAEEPQPASVSTSADGAIADDGEAEAVAAPAVRKGKGKGRGKLAASATAAAPAAGTAGTTPEPPKAATTAEEDEDAEIERLLAEADEAMTPVPKPVKSQVKLSAKTPPQELEEEDGDVDMDDIVVSRRRRGAEEGDVDEDEVAPPAAAASSAVGAGNAPGATGATGKRTASTSPSAAAAATTSDQGTSVRRLAELMLVQFNSADGYLHLPNLQADEKGGLVIPIDDESAQVDPFALYSAFSGATVDEGDSVEVRALKTVWSAYNTHVEAQDSPLADEDVVNYHKGKSVEVLVFGALALRMVARNTLSALDAPVPAFGFPLLTSDTRPFGTKKKGLVTDVNRDRAEEALRLYKEFFANKDVRHTPFRPAVDFNAGCNVVQLVGTTLHLYETSLKESVRDQAIRIRFAEAMLGVLHCVHHEVIPRINLVHYHILTTSIASSSAADSFDGPAIVGIDTSGMFSQQEKLRLRALQGPLGLTDMPEFNSISDLIDEIEDMGISVTHDVVQSRDDLEALLTPTLAQLLPEADAEEGDVDDEDAPARSVAGEAKERAAAKRRGADPEPDADSHVKPAAANASGKRASVGAGKRADAADTGSPSTGAMDEAAVGAASGSVDGLATPPPRSGMVARGARGRRGRADQFDADPFGDAELFTSSKAAAEAAYAGKDTAPKGRRKAAASVVPPAVAAAPPTAVSEPSVAPMTAGVRGRGRAAPPVTPPKQMASAKPRAEELNGEEDEAGGDDDDDDDAMGAEAEDTDHGDAVQAAAAPSKGVRHPAASTRASPTGRDRRAGGQLTGSNRRPSHSAAEEELDDADDEPFVAHGDVSGAKSAGPAVASKGRPVAVSRPSRGRAAVATPPVATHAASRHDNEADDDDDDDDEKDDDERNAQDEVDDEEEEDDGGIEVPAPRGRAGPSTSHAGKATAAAGRHASAPAQEARRGAVRGRDDDDDDDDDDDGDSAELESHAMSAAVGSGARTGGSAAAATAPTPPSSRRRKAAARGSSIDDHEVEEEGGHRHEDHHSRHRHTTTTTAHDDDDGDDDNDEDGHSMSRESRQVVKPTTPPPPPPPSSRTAPHEMPRRGHGRLSGRAPVAPAMGHRGSHAAPVAAVVDTVADDDDKWFQTKRSRR